MFADKDLGVFIDYHRTTTGNSKHLLAPELWTATSCAQSTPYMPSMNVVTPRTNLSPENHLAGQLCGRTMNISDSP